ncbi:MAG: class I SAM-dependent methyltransferase [Pseudomonadota bacterium]
MSTMTRETQNPSKRNARVEMNNMYRWTRHVYDFSRKFFLLGRDILINHLNAQEGHRICEVGCGTARNLVKMAKRYPMAEFYGVDASDEMLKTAEDNLKKASFVGRIPLKQGFAQNFNPVELFELSNKRRFDKIVFSYALSMIPPWKESIDHALNILPKGGEIHIVDFGGQEGLPAWFRAFLFWWLKLFHVYHKPEIQTYLMTLEERGKGTLHIRALYEGYAYYAVFTKA